MHKTKLKQEAHIHQPTAWIGPGGGTAIYGLYRYVLL